MHTIPKNQNTLIVGGTGTGKTNLIELLVQQDIETGTGLVLFDRHGDVYNSTVQFLSEIHPKIADKVILFDLGETKTGQVIGFDPLPSNDSYILHSIIAACLSVWDVPSEQAPRLTKWLANILRVIAESNVPLSEAEHLLSSQLDQNEMGMNRLLAFLENPVIRSVISKQNVLDFDSILDGKILLVNLNGGGRVSPDYTELLGIMLINEIIRAAKNRDPDDPNLNLFSLYLDDILVTRDIALAFEGLRKYKGFSTTTTQSLSLIKSRDESVYSSLMSNAQIKVIFKWLLDKNLELLGESPHERYPIKDLKPFEAFVDTGSGVPEKVEFPKAFRSTNSPDVSAKRVADFKQNVFEANRQYYK